MTFEFDRAKSAANKAKHGIDFEQAQALWSGKTVAIELPFPNERRRVVIGKIGDKHWAAILTVRGSAFRLISVRRARDKEKVMYEQARPDIQESDTKS